MAITDFCVPLVLPDGLELSAAFIQMIFLKYIDPVTGQANPLIRYWYQYRSDE
jgi:hypothetical protein